MKRLACLVLLSLVLACGNWSGGPERGMGAVGRDAAGRWDGGERGSGPGEDGGAGGRDAAARDAGVCGALGQACGPAGSVTACPKRLRCVNGACVRSSSMCGGIVAAACSTSAPVCLTYAWASDWPCVTRADRDCICATPGGLAAFSSECGAATRP